MANFVQGGIEIFYWSEAQNARTEFSAGENFGFEDRCAGQIGEGQMVAAANFTTRTYEGLSVPCLVRIG